MLPLRVVIVYQTLYWVSLIRLGAVPPKLPCFIIMVRNCMVSSGEGEQADTHWDSNITFIHTSKRQDDMPEWLVILQVCLVKLAAFANYVFSM